MSSIQPKHFAIVLIAVILMSTMAVGIVCKAFADNKTPIDINKFVINDENKNPVSQVISFSAKDTNTQGKQISVTVKSSELNGNLINEVLTVVTDNTTVAKGYTPFTFNAKKGTLYTVSLSKYQDYTFDHWGNGFTGSTIQITPTRSMILIGFYKKTENSILGTSPPAPAPSQNTSTTTATLSVNSLSLSGSPINGLWTVIDSNGQQVSTGYTPFTYSVTTGNTYTLTVSDYQQYIFDHWEGGSTSRSITITPTQNTALKAYYNTGSNTAPAPLPSPTTSPAPQTAGKTGVIVPLYMYPGSYWNTLIQAKSAHPNVPIIAIVNPASGPGNSIDSNYVNGIQNLKSAGIIVLGYVYTSYGSRGIADAEYEINEWKSWYNVNGIFFDEMVNWAGYENHYSTLNSYTKSLGMTMTVGNPGSDTSSSYIGTMDNIVIYESPGMPGTSSLAGWHTNYNKNNFSIIPFGIASLDTTSIGTASNYVGYVYATDDNLPNPYDTLPWYIGNLVASLDV